MGRHFWLTHPGWARPWNCSALIEHFPYGGEHLVLAPSTAGVWQREIERWLGDAPGHCGDVCCDGCGRSAGKTLAAFSKLHC